MSRRIRKHANPFTVFTQLGRLDRTRWFGREAPVEVDLGCGGAAFLFERARNHPSRDFVGLEVRRPLVEAAMARREAEGLRNVAVFHANAHTNLVDLVAPGDVQEFFIQFPDPCFKKRHHKRRLLQPAQVRAMALVLPIGGHIFAQSDVQPLAEEMFHFLQQDGAFESCYGSELRIPNPFAERTEWERQHQREGEPVWRMRFRKVREPSGPVPEPDFRDIQRPEYRRPAG